MPITLIIAIALISLVFLFFFNPAKPEKVEESINGKKILGAKVSIEIYESFVKLAQEKDLTISSYLRALIVDAIENRQLPKGYIIPNRSFKEPRKNSVKRFHWNKSAVSDMIIPESKLKDVPSHYMRKKYPNYIKIKR